jgi:hypothetical protein
MVCKVMKAFIAAALAWSAEMDGLRIKRVQMEPEQEVSGQKVGVVKQDETEEQDPDQAVAQHFFYNGDEEQREEIQQKLETDEGKEVVKVLCELRDKIDEVLEPSETFSMNYMKTGDMVNKDGTRMDMAEIFIVVKEESVREKIDTLIENSQSWSNTLVKTLTQKGEAAALPVLWTQINVELVSTALQFVRLSGRSKIAAAPVAILQDLREAYAGI